MDSRYRSVPRYVRLVRTLAFASTVAGCSSTPNAGWDGNVADTLRDVSASDVASQDIAVSDVTSSDVATADAQAIDTGDETVAADNGATDTALNDVPVTDGCVCPPGILVLDGGNYCVPGTPEYTGMGCHPVTGPLRPPELRDA